MEGELMILLSNQVKKSKGKQGKEAAKYGTGINPYPKNICSIHITGCSCGKGKEGKR